MNSRPKFLDAVLLSCFILLITFQPYLFHHEVIMMESGIHLPGIQALFDGKVPYRDFLYLRGPLELYVPAFLMKAFGENMIWLPIFYYAGTVLTLIFAASWMTEAWQHELIEDFKKARPRYVVMTNIGHRTFLEEWYFRNKLNIKKHETMTNLILNSYTPIRTYESVSLYERN